MSSIDTLHASPVHFHLLETKTALAGGSAFAITSCVLVLLTATGVPLGTVSFSILHGTNLAAFTGFVVSFYLRNQKIRALLSQSLQDQLGSKILYYHSKTREVTGPDEAGAILRIKHEVDPRVVKDFIAGVEDCIDAVETYLTAYIKAYHRVPSKSVGGAVGNFLYSAAVSSEGSEIAKLKKASRLLKEGIRSMLQDEKQVFRFLAIGAFMAILSKEFPDFLEKSDEEFFKDFQAFLEKQIQIEKGFADLNKAAEELEKEKAKRAKKAEGGQEGEAVETTSREDVDEFMDKVPVEIGDLGIAIGRNCVEAMQEALQLLCKHAPESKKTLENLKKLREIQAKMQAIDTRCNTEINVDHALGETFVKKRVPFIKEVMTFGEQIEKLFAKKPEQTQGENAVHQGRSGERQATSRELRAEEIEREAHEKLLRKAMKEKAELTLDFIEAQLKFIDDIAMDVIMNDGAGEGIHGIYEKIIPFILENVKTPIFCQLLPLVKEEVVRQQQKALGEGEEQISQASEEEGFLTPDQPITLIHTAINTFGPMLINKFVALGVGYVPMNPRYKEYTRQIVDSFVSGMLDSFFYGILVKEHPLHVKLFAMLESKTKELDVPIFGPPEVDGDKDWQEYLHSYAAYVREQAKALDAIRYN